MMRMGKSRLMLFAAIAAVVSVAGNFISAAVLAQTKSNSWLIFSALAVGTSLLAAYVTLVASQRPSLEVDKEKVRVFLSYAREDEEQIDKLYKALQEKGFEPWMDVKKLTAGENWITGIEEAIEKADFFVAVISKNSIDKRGFIQKEIKLALDLAAQISNQKINIIPVRLDDTKVPEPLAKFKQILLFEENGFYKLVAELEMPPEGPR